MAIDITNAISVIQAKESALTNTDDSTEIIKLLNAIKLTEDQVIRSYATVTDLPIASADNEGSIHYVRDTDYLYGSNGCQWNVLGQYFAGNGICISNNCIINTFTLGDYNTDALAEGSTNLYYTDAKVDTNLNQGTAANGDYLKWNGCDYEWATVPAGYTDNDVNTFLAGGTAGNIVTCGYLAGPATFTIDPAAVGDNTGTVVIAGNLQVDGTTTTINSTTLAVDDLNITLASGSANATTSDGAGITADLGSDGSATLTYSSSNDRWEMNKSLATSVIGQVSDISNHSTADLTEGTNLYYTDARVDARLAASLGDNQQLITASDNFAAGDIVVYDNGSYVKATFSGTSGLSASATDSNSLATDPYFAANVIYDQVTDRYVVFRQNGGALYAVVAQATSTGFTLGTELQFYNYTTNEVSVTIDKNANKIICAWVGSGPSYADGGLRVAAFEIDPATNTITMGNIAADTDQPNINNVSIGYDTDTGKFLIICNYSTDVRCYAGYVDGQNIVLGTRQSLTVSGGPTWFGIAYDQTAQRFFIGHDANGRHAAVAQINGDNSITFGAWTTIPNESTPGNPYYKTSEGKIYLPYISTNYKASLGEVTIDNVANTLTFNTVELTATPDVLSVGMVYLELIDQFYFYYKKFNWAGGEEYIADVVFNNGTPSLANSIETSNMFNYNTGEQYKATVGIDRVVGVYGTYLTYSTFASINSNASSWIGIAAEDIADTATGLIDLSGAINRSQTGLVKDTVYYVNQLGSLTTTPTTLGMIGKAISTTDLQIFGNAVIELSKAIDVDFTTNTPTTTSGLVLTSDGDSSYSFQAPVVTTQIADLTDVDFTTNTPTTTSGLVLTSDGDSTYSFQPAAAESTYQENKIIATSDGQTVFAFSAAFEGYNSTTPANSHLEIYWNGSRLIYGPNNDYTITANNEITLTSGTGIVTGDIIFAVSISNMTLSRLYGP